MDVIEVSADGGFDIPPTPIVVPTSRTTTRSSIVEPKPRRIRIQLEDDDDDDDDCDINGGERVCEAPPATCPASAETGEHNEKIGGGTPASNRPRYRIDKIETSGEDPVLEITIFFSSARKTAPISTAEETTANARDARGSDAPYAPACPSVSISSDGRTVAVDPDATAEGGGLAKGEVVSRRRRFSLKLPHRVVPGTAMSFFSEGDVTVRAVLAEGE